jgi:hypothetical protein
MAQGRSPQKRGATSADKKRKDINQASALLSMLRKDRPGDIEAAKADLAKRGNSWQKKLSVACAREKIDLTA